jgi:hypothetical protein
MSTDQQKPSRRVRSSKTQIPGQQISFGNETDFDRIATILHEKITKSDGSGNNVINENTAVKMNMGMVFSIIGSLIIGVSAASVYWTKKDISVSNTLEDHSKRITTVEKTMNDVQQMRNDVIIMKEQLNNVNRSVESQKATLDYLVEAANNNKQPQRPR